MPRLSTSDFEALMALLGEVQSVDGPRLFTTTLLDRMTELFDCQLASYSELDHANRVILDEAYCSAEAADDVACETLDDDEWARLWASPLRPYKRRHPGRVVLLSDFFSRRERTSSLEINPAGDLGGVDSMHVLIASTGTYGATVALGRDHEFGERERRMLELLRPHLAGRLRAVELERRLDAALAALERGDEERRGVLLLGPQGSIEFASRRARRLLESYFGDPSPAAELAGLRTGGEPVVVSGPAGRLVVESIDSGRALLLTAQSSAALALTDRERDVMRCVANGLSNSQIAAILVVEPSTVRKHLEHVYHKLGVSSRTAALAKLGASLDA